MPIKQKKSQKKKQAPKKDTSQKKSFIPFAALFIAILVIVSAAIMHYMQSKTAFQNLTYKQVPSSGIGLKVPKDWMQMEHFATTMFHDAKMNENDLPATITLSTYESVLNDLSKASKEQRHDQLQLEVNKLKASSNSIIDYSNIQITDTGNGEVIIADSTETITYISTVKKAVNVFLLTDSGEVKRVSIVVNQDLYDQNRSTMYKIARSARLL